jgi:hypothetical protein
MKKYISINIFENEKYRIQKVKDGFHDQFQILEKNNILYVKRVDKDEGWGADLKFKIFDKVKNEEIIKVIGNSNINEIQVNLEKKISKNHYENNFFKLYSISDYSDLFNITYDNISKNLTVKRLDATNGWDQDLVIEYYEKITENIKHINFGSSTTNQKVIIVDINKLEYIKVPNIFIDEKIKIEKVLNEYNDKFIFEYNHKTNILKVIRSDAIEGWGQHLMVNVYFNSKKYTIYIGSNKNNICFKKLDLNEYKVYIGLTVIPSRINIVIDNLKHFVRNQVYEYEKIFITIPNNYKRFKNSIDINSINKLKNIKNVEVINIENDLGPASKYLGPYINNKIQKDDILIIIDDDRKYNKYLINNLMCAVRSFSQYKFFSGLWSYFFDKNYKLLKDNHLEVSICKEKNEDNFKFGNGLGGFFGFALKIDNKEEFIDYNLKILELIPKSFFHDEGILLGYIKKKEETIIYVKHMGCIYYKDESVDALCTSGLCDRSLVEKDILYRTNYELLLD